MIIYVNAGAGLDGNGTKERPFKRINEAARVARPGDTVLVAPGVYREYVNPVNAGTEDQRIEYRSEEPLKAVITGAEPLTGWQQYRGNVWTARVQNGVFGNYNPYTTYVYGDWYFAGKTKHTGCVWLNGAALYEAASVEECEQGAVYPCSWDQANSTRKWYAEQDGDGDGSRLCDRRRAVVRCGAERLQRVGPACDGRERGCLHQRCYLRIWSCHKP